MVLHDKYACIESASGCLASFVALSLLSCGGSARVICPRKSGQEPERAIINRRGRVGNLQVKRHDII